MRYAFNAQIPLSHHYFIQTKEKKMLKYLFIIEHKHVEHLFDGYVERTIRLKLEAHLILIK